MPFDVDAFLRARQPWEVKLTGRTYQAAWVSAEEVAGFLVGFQGENGGPPPLAQQDAAVRGLVGRMFPGWHPPWRHPVTLIMGLDREARGALLADFFVWWKAQRNGSSTNGNGSQSKTPPPAPPTGSTASA